MHCVPQNTVGSLRQRGEYKLLNFLTEDVVNSDGSVGFDGQTERND